MKTVSFFKQHRKGVLRDDFDQKGPFFIYNEGNEGVTENSSEGVSSSDDDIAKVDDFYDNKVSNIYDQLEKDMDGQRPTAEDVGTYLKHGTEEQQELFYILEKSAESKARWSAFKMEKILEFNQKEDATIKGFLEQNFPAKILDDPGALVDFYQESTEFKTEANGQYFLEQHVQPFLQKKKQLQYEQYNEIVSKLPDKEVIDAMKQSFEDPRLSFEQRETYLYDKKEGVEAKVKEYEKSLKVSETLEKSLSKKVAQNKEYKKEFELIQQEYQKGKQVYDEKFYSPNAYLKALKGLQETIDNDTFVDIGKCMRKVNDKQVRHLPEIPNEPLSYADFRDTLSRDFYGISAKEAADPDVRKLMRKKTKQLHKQWSKDQKQAQKEDLRLVDKEKKDALSVVSSKQLSDVPAGMKGPLEFDAFRDQLRQAHFYNIAPDQLKDPKVRRVIRRKTEFLHKQWQKKQAPETKEGIVEDVLSPEKESQAIAKIQSMSIDNLPSIPKSVKTYEGFRDVLVQSNFYSLSNKSVQSSSKIREALWKQNNDLFESWKSQEKQSVMDQKEETEQQKNIDSQIQDGMKAIENSSFEDLPTIPAGVSTYKQFTDILIKDSFYELEADVVAQSPAMREALWKKNNDLFDQWLESKDFGAALQSIYSKNTQDLPLMDPEISRYEDFTQVLIDTNFYGIDPETIMATEEIREGLWEHNNDLYKEWKAEGDAEKVTSKTLDDIQSSLEDVDSYDAFTEILIDENIYGLDEEDIKNSLALRKTLWDHNNTLYSEWLQKQDQVDDEIISEGEEDSLQVPDTTLAYDMDWEGMDDRLSVDQKERGVTRFNRLLDPNDFGLHNMLNTSEMPMAGFIFESLSLLPDNRFDEVLMSLKGLSVERHNKQNMSEWLRVFTQTIGEDYIDTNMTGALEALREDYQTYFKSNLDEDWTEVDEEVFEEEEPEIIEEDLAEEEFSDEILEDIVALDDENIEENIIEEEVVDEPEAEVDSKTVPEASDPVEDEVEDVVGEAETIEELLDDEKEEDVSVVEPEVEDKPEDLPEEVIDELDLDEVIDDIVDIPEDDIIEEIVNDEDSEVEPIDEKLEDDLDIDEEPSEVEEGEKELEDTEEVSEEESDEIEDEFLNTDIVHDLTEPLIIEEDTIEEENEEENEEEEKEIDAFIEEPIVVESSDSAVVDIPKESVSDYDPVFISDDKKESTEVILEEDIEDELVNNKVDQSVVGIKYNKPAPLKDMDESSSAFQEQYLTGNYQSIGKVLEHVQSYAQYEFGLKTSASIANEQLRMLEIKGSTVQDIFSDIAYRLRQQSSPPKDFGLHVDIDTFYVRINGQVFDYPYTIVDDSA